MRVCIVVSLFYRKAITQGTSARSTAPSIEILRDPLRMSPSPAGIGNAERLLRSNLPRLAMAAQGQRQTTSAAFQRHELVILELPTMIRSMSRYPRTSSLAALLSVLAAVPAAGQLVQDPPPELSFLSTILKVRKNIPYEVWGEVSSQKGPVHTNRASTGSSWPKPRTAPIR